MFLFLYMPLPADEIAQGEGGGINSGNGGGVSEGGVEEDSVVDMPDEDDCRVISFDRNEGGVFDDGCDRDAGANICRIRDENGGGGKAVGGGGEDVSGSVTILEDEGMVDLLVVDNNGDSMLAPCGGCGQDVTGTHRCSGYDVHMHLFCGDLIGEEEYGQKFRCLWCRR